MQSDDLNFQIKIGPDSTGDPEPIGKKGKKAADKAEKSNQDDVTSPSISNNQPLFDLKKSAHPIAVIFHLLFKALGIVAYSNYFLLYAISDGKILTFIVIILCAAFDFWITKNITGRLLVGLRWWSEISEDGNEKWFFESYDEKINFNVFDKTVFWWSQIIMCIFWLVMTIYKLITFDFYWATSAIVCLIMAGANYIGFFKCSKEHKKKLKGAIQKVAIKGLKSNLT